MNTITKRFLHSDKFSKQFSVLILVITISFLLIKLYNNVTYGFPFGEEEKISKWLTDSIFYTVILIAGIILVLNIEQHLNQSKPLDLKNSVHKNYNNKIRLSVFLIISFLSLPWIFAAIGIYISDIPVFSLIFIGKYSLIKSDTNPAVHLGNHHGLEAYLALILVILLSYCLDHPVRFKILAYRASMLFFIIFLSLFALVTGLDDFIGEQIIKRNLEFSPYRFLDNLFYSPLFFYYITIVSVLITGIYIFVVNYNEHLTGEVFNNLNQYLNPEGLQTRFFLIENSNKLKNIAILNTKLIK